MWWILKKNVENLLEYVYEGIDDINDVPTAQEYQKLKRIMQIMQRFYEKGTEAKAIQKQDAIDEYEKLQIDIKMINDQLAVLEQFPPIHPKRQFYDNNLQQELESLQSQITTFIQKIEEFTKLHEWSLTIVAAVRWLGGNIEDYCNETFKVNPRLTITHIDINKEQLEIHKKGLDEITYNLQESQDFFEASLDGRLNRFHQLEKCMIEGMIQVLKKYPESNSRRQFIEGELQKDLEYVTENMKENPKRHQHKERMKSMHRDFFRVLRWQRRKLKVMLGIDDNEVEDEKEETPKPAAISTGAGACPMDGRNNFSGGKCPMK